jgi:hypothetical protein
MKLPDPVYTEKGDLQRVALLRLCFARAARPLSVRDALAQADERPAFPLEFRKAGCPSLAALLHVGAFGLAAAWRRDRSGFEDAAACDGS